MFAVDKDKLRDVVKTALIEDVGSGDVTTEISVLEDIRAVASFVAREEFILSGVFVVDEVFKQVDDSLRLSVMVNDGSVVCENDCVMTVEGSAKSILTGERVALNFLQRMSGISTLTGKFTKEVEGTDAVILDTRKTTPGLRFIEKYSVRVGGGTNHRFGLYDRFLFKDNHIAVAALNFRSDIDLIIRKARSYKPSLKVEVEVDTIGQLKQLLPSEPDIILLDNFSIPDLCEAVSLAKGKAFLEASGGITLDTVRDVALTGVDGISVGALTYSYRAVDISLDMKLC